MLHKLPKSVEIKILGMMTTTIASVFKYILARVLEWHTQNKCTGKDKDVLTKTKIKN